MQEVMQKRLAIVVMMVMTALKISLAVGFLLKNDIFTNFFLDFKIIIFLPHQEYPERFFLPHPSSPARRGSYFSKTPPSPLALKRGSTAFP